MKKLALTAISLLSAGICLGAADLRRPAPGQGARACGRRGLQLDRLLCRRRWRLRHVESRAPQRLSIGGATSVSRHDNGGRGWFGTVQVGCDYQFGSNIVIGAFGDYDFSQHQGRYGGLVALTGRRGEAQVVRGRPVAASAGFRSSRTQLLVFVSGGYTQARFDAVDFTIGLRRPVASASRSTPIAAGSSARGYEYQPRLPARACSGKPNIALPTTATSTSAPRTAAFRSWPFDRIAQIRPHRPQRAGVALQLRRPGCRALLIEAERS